MSQSDSKWLPPLPESDSVSIGRGWKARLLLTKQGSALSVVANALIALRQAPEWGGVLYFNESSLATIVKLAPPFQNATPLPFTWTDEHDVLAAAWLQHQGICVNKDVTAQAICAVAREHSFHPVRDYLDSVTWDGTERIDNWLTLYMGTDSSDYTRAVGAKFLIGGVARIYQPGVKNDTCPIFEGPQGAQKSTALRTLAGADFFTDDIAELGSKDSVLQTRGVWIIELGELDALSRGELSRVKAFMSRQVDRIRPPYGRRVLEAPRECVFAGTVNKEMYLKDETGGRRFWPVKCGCIRIADLERDRDQLWAEARVRFQAGSTWWMDNEELVKSAADETKARYEADPWDEILTEWLRNPLPRHDPLGRSAGTLTSTSASVTVTDVLLHCIGKQPGAWTQSDQNRVSRSLVSMGWKRKMKRTGGHREWRYFAPVTSVTTLE